MAGEDEEAIRGLYQALLDRWNERDASGMAALLLDDGLVVGFDGSQMQGAAAVRDQLAQIFANHTPARYVGIVRRVSFPSPGIAILHAVAGMVPPGQRHIKAENNAVQTVTAVKRDERWRIALYQNTPARFDGRPALVTELTGELERAMTARAGELFESR
jgi:uncharacterized protein (TIGR02246 family)